MRVGERIYFALSTLCEMKKAARSVGPVSYLFIQMNYFCLRRRAVVKVETHACFYLVEPLASGRARVDEQHVSELGDAFDSQDVAVAADEHVGRLLA